MIIDFHTHIFPEKIAGPTLDFLESRCHTKPATNGMADGLSKSTKSADIDLSIALPVVTKPKQFASINGFAYELNQHDYGESGILSFGGIHPDSEDYKGQLRELKNMGFQGIKLHPDYQGVFIDDIRYKRIIDYASELGLIISVHAGFDPGYPDCVHCTPKRAREVIREVQPEQLVLAHLGGYLRWDEVEDYLVGEPAYFDTAVIFHAIEEEQFLRIVENHGIHKILFATDSPWAKQEEFVAKIQNMNMSYEAKEAILGGNAMKLLNLAEKYIDFH